VSDDYEAPYRRLAAVEEQQQQNDLVDLYLKLYKEKYRQEFIVPVDRNHFKHIKDLRNVAGPKAMGILIAYFEMRDDWFSKQHHSLECLLKNINRVNAHLQQKQKAQELKGLILLNFYCEACGELNSVPVKPSYDGNTPYRCNTCIEKNRPFWRPNKEERRKALMNINRAFPELSNEKEN
jgi:hypothetical protein